MGEDLETQDVAAKFEDGILKLTLPKTAPRQLPRSATISIE